MKKLVPGLLLSAVILFSAPALVAAQSVVRELKLSEGGSISILNLTGRVEVVARPGQSGATLSATSPEAIADNELRIETGGSLRIETLPSRTNKRIDISLTVPERVKLNIETREGEIRVTGDVESVEAKTDTGTIAADVPTRDLKYDFFWTSSRPRFLSDIELEKVKEKSGGKFQLKGKYRNAENEERTDTETEEGEEASKGDGERQRRDDAESGSVPPAVASGSDNIDDESKTKKPKSKISRSVELAFTTARGIVLLNIPPNEVSSDLRERPLTNAAKAIIRSGDISLMDSIRRASPKYFGEYSRTLPPMRREPSLTSRTMQADAPGDTVKEAVVRVTDMYNRSIPGLGASDFIVAENALPRDIISVKPHTAPVNLVLLLDVSGSVDNYVNFIRKAARAFIDTARDEDRISLILFNDDVKVLS